MKKTIAESSPSEPMPPSASDPDASRYDAPADTPADPDASNYEAPQPGSGSAPGDRRLPRPFGDYELVAEIARGGMGVVYKARQLKAGGRVVALKMILGGNAASSDTLERFRREAHAVAGLDHPGIVPIHEVGEVDGQPFYTMPLVEGGSLHQLVAQGPLEARAAARLVQQVAEAVQHAHDHGIIHRDIKPHNILLASGESPRLTDFGLARTREGGGSVTGEQLGTPSYMAPEQAAGQVRAISPATDVYALGAVLYCLLTGRPPFQSSSPVQTMRLVLEREPVPVRALNPAVPRDLETVCLKCLEKDAGKRYGSAAALAEELGRFQRGEPVVARPVGRLARGWRWCKRNPVVAALLAAVGLLLGTGAALVTWQWRVAVAALDRAERAQQERALAQVQALREAVPGAVPGLLRELADNRATVLPRLRELWQQGGDRGRRLRVGLALLPVEPETVRDALARWMLEAADPAEVLLVRDGLTAHAATLAPGLWRSAEDAGTTSAARFRALVALARFDPDNARWQKVGPAAVEELLSSNPLYLGSWVQALRPVRQALGEPLAEVFRGRRLAEFRQVAATVLADYAADRPELLSDLLLDADPKQDAVLFPVLQRSRARAVERFHAELATEAGFDWKDAALESAWGTADAAVVRRVEAARGLVAERFALCQALPLEEFDAVAAALAKAGYRPVRLRPYSAASSLRVAAVWTRDGRPWKAVHGQTADEVRRQDTERRKAGYRPVDVAGYLDGGKECYVALWVKGGPAEESDLYVGVPERRHRADGWGPMRAAKCQPSTFQVLIDADGARRFSSVWRKAGPAGSILWDDDEKTHAGRGLGDGLPVDVCQYPDPQAANNVRAELGGWLTGSPWLGLNWRHRNLLWPHPERSYGGCFAKSATFDHVAVLGLTPAEQLRRGRELAAQGYRPAALSATVFAASRERQRPEGRLTASLWHRPAIAEEVKERLAKRQANAATALLRLGRAERVWPLLQHRPDPRLRSYLIHCLSPLGVDARTLVKRLAEEPDVSAKRALLLCLGEFERGQLPESERQVLVPTLLRLYRDDPDAGLHGAGDWLLRRWGQADRLRVLDKELASRERPRPEGRRWTVNGQGQTMVLIPGPVEFLMGTPRNEAGREGGPEGKVEKQHRRRIGRSFAIAAREVTVEQFLRFRKDHAYNKTYSPTPEHPVNGVSWYDAAAYCNWLSEKEGIPEKQWCYVPNEKGEYADGMRMKPNWLRLPGYRLPTEAEWEFACRAGAVTSRYYGETEELLGQYAWYTKNSQDRVMLPAGDRSRPNDLGLFDMLGNALEWCQDGIFYYPEGQYGQPAQDRERAGDIKDIKDKLSRVLRGGSFIYPAPVVRSGDRNRYAPANRGSDRSGFRPARTAVNGRS